MCFKLSTHPAMWEAYNTNFLLLTDLGFEPCTLQSPIQWTKCSEDLLGMSPSAFTWQWYLTKYSFALNIVKAQLVGRGYLTKNS